MKKMAKEKKIYIVGDKTYKTEKGFRNAIKRKYTGYKYEVYKLIETGKVIEERERLEAAKGQDERDLKIKAVLGNLSDKEKRTMELETNMESLLKIISDKTVDKSSWRSLWYNLSRLKTPEDRLKYLKKRRHNALKFSDDIEYYKCLLRVHGFTISSWNKVDGMSEKQIESFNKAKEELKKERKK